jgi:hypothetical protein
MIVQSWSDDLLQCFVILGYLLRMFVSDESISLLPLAL